MRLRWLPIAGLAFLLGLIIHYSVIDGAYQYVPYNSEYHTSLHQHRMAHDSQEISAYAALAAVFVAIASAFIAYLQFNGLREANRQTERSVDAYVDAERGRMSLSFIRLNNRMDHPYLFGFRNIGRSPVVVISFGFDRLPAKDLRAMPERPVPQMRAVYHPLMAGEQFVNSDPVHRKPGSFDGLPIDLLLRNDLGNQISTGCYFWVQYISNGIVYICTTAVWVHSGQSAPRIHPSLRMTNDVRCGDGTVPLQ